MYKSMQEKQEKPFTFKMWHPCAPPLAASCVRAGEGGESLEEIALFIAKAGGLTLRISNGGNMAGQSPQETIIL